MVDQRRVLNRLAGLAACIVAASILVSGPAVARTETVVPSSGPPTASLVRIDLRATGRLFAPGSAAVAEQPIDLEARFDFREAPAGAGAVRRYDRAVARMTRGESVVRRSLGEDARDVCVVLAGAAPRPQLADGFLSREEIDLLDTPFDALLIDGIRPGTDVAVADTWRLPDELTAALVGIDVVDSGGLDVRLDAVTDGLASLCVVGTVVGRVDGTSSRLTVDGKATAAATPAEQDGGWRLAGRVTRLEATIRERREPGWVSPGIDVVATMTLQRTEPAPATDDAPPAGGLAAAAADRPRGAGSSNRAWHRHPQGRYTMVIDARWRVVEDGPEGLVMRLIDADGLVAQCSLVPLPRVAADAAPGEATVQTDVRRSLGEQFGHFSESEATTRDDGTRVVRVVADGAAADRPFRWIHQLLTGPAGHQVAVTCLLEPAMAERFAAADRELVAGLIVLPDPPARTAITPGGPDRR